MGTTGADRAARSAADSVDGVGVVSTGLRGGDRVGPSRERGEKKKQRKLHGNTYRVQWTTSLI